MYVDTPRPGAGRIPLYVRERLREWAGREEERRQLAAARAGRDVCWTEEEDEDEPLVTVRIATYNRGPLIVERALDSIRRQTYERLEILVVGDNCDAATEAAVTSFPDARLRFVQLPTRGVYPSTPYDRWRVAGTHPMNAGLVLAAGDWMAPCDDDDEFTPDHVEVLLSEAKRRRLEFVWSQAEIETPTGWSIIGEERVAHGNITHGAVMYSLGLRFLRHSNTCWKLREPGDWNLFRRMGRIGVRMGFVPRVTYKHFVEAHARPAVEG